MSSLCVPLTLEKSLELKLGLTLLKGVQVALWLSTPTLGQTLENVERLSNNYTRRTASIAKQGFKKRPYYIWIVTASDAKAPESKMSEHERW